MVLGSSCLLCSGDCQEQQAVPDKRGEEQHPIEGQKAGSLGDPLYQTGGLCSGGRAAAVLQRTVIGDAFRITKSNHCGKMDPPSIGLALRSGARPDLPQCASAVETQPLAMNGYDRGRETFMNKLREILSVCLSDPRWHKKTGPPDLHSHEKSGGAPQAA